MTDTETEASIAQRALEHALGTRCHGLHRVAAGRSSSTWAASTTSGEWVVRVPAPAPGRTITYRSEATICERLHGLGHPVATWTLVDVDGIECSVGARLPGAPIGAGERFAPAAAERFGRLLADLHHLDVEGFGPLANERAHLRGVSVDLDRGILDRWHLARIWPFDHPGLDTHPISAVAPDLAQGLDDLRPRILDASGGPVGLLHSDLHRQHLLVDAHGSLTGVLDFGDAFVGAQAWDFALLHWYNGPDDAHEIARHHPDGTELVERGRDLAIAVGLYKLDKSPDDTSTLPRLRGLLDQPQ